ncbi:MAG: 16S rRNA (guanine(966)-N(2))-methyltransferase RsmD [Actinomycetota bacterium]|nr:16S rRNA (guanine(966)-N(2))-methyltransferase RsmD [Actinomycetota bacterium]
MRVIGGSARGRPLRAPRSGAVRPTSDRVREAMFDVLTHLGAVWGKRVLDGFGGSGALGIEALSRGASAVTFVEADRQVAAALEANLASTGFRAAPGVRIVRGDLLAHLSAERPHFDLALLDPPYAFSDWSRLLELVHAEVVVLESDREIELPARFQIHRSYRYGTTLVTVARAAAPEGVEGPAGQRRAESARPWSEPASEARKERA